LDVVAWLKLLNTLIKGYALKSSDGTAANQTCHDEGPLTLERSM